MNGVSIDRVITRKTESLFRNILISCAESVSDSKWSRHMKRQHYDFVRSRQNFETPIQGYDDKYRTVVNKTMMIQTAFEGLDD